MKLRFIAALGGLLSIALLGVATGAVSAATPKRVKVTGEVIDSWCYLSEIMYPEGTAHHQCAIWCAAGGIPVGILGEDGTVYIVLKLGEDTNNVANPSVLEIQSRKVTVDGDLIERDGMNYLLINQIVADQGIVNLTHEDYGIQPFGE
ncbi:MAG: hypothetical protein ACTSW2_05285 [Alphaproteobacteria bacterium]